MISFRFPCVPVGLVAPLDASSDSWTQTQWASRIPASLRSTISPRRVVSRIVRATRRD